MGFDSDQDPHFNALGSETLILRCVFLTRAARSSQNSR